MSTRKFSSNQEKQLAYKLGGKVTPNSGGTQFGGGDVLLDDWLIEAKTPMKPQTSFSIKEEWIEKAAEQAFEQNKNNSTLAFRFNPDGPDYFIIDFNTFKYLVELMSKDDWTEHDEAVEDTLFGSYFGQS